MPTAHLHYDNNQKKRIPKIKLNKVLDKITKNPMHFLMIPLLILMTVISIVMYASYNDAREQLKQFQNTNETQKIEKPLLETIGEITQLPSNTSPRIQTITDINDLKQDIFFARAQNEDLLLIYEGSNRVVIYRPSNNKIIESAVVDLNKLELVKSDNSPKDVGTDVETETTNQQITVSVYNGTDTEGLASSVKEKLENDFTAFEIEVKEIGNAQQEYDNTFVYVSGDVESLKIHTVAEFVEAKINSEAPEDETLGTSDISIFLGSDFTD